MSENGQNQEIPASLPLLGNSTNGPIINFANIYQNDTHDEEMLTSLREISTQLARSNKEKKKHLVHEDRVSLVTDQLQYLLTTRENNSNENATELSEREVEKGKPMKRFASNSSLPFTTVNDVSHAKKSMDDEKDQVYNKVQQIQWEDNIIWGIDFKKKDAEQVEEEIVETEEDGVHHKKTHKKSHDTSSYNLSKTVTKSETTHTTSPYRSLKKDKAQPTTLSAPSTSKNPTEDFDITKPRNYRWELSEEEKTENSSTSKRTSPKSLVSEQLPCALNKELENFTWVDSIGWNATIDMPESKLVLDDNDTSLIFSLQEMEDVRPTLRIPERKLGAAEQRLEQLDKQRREKKKRIDEVMGNLEFGEETAEGRLGTEGGGKKSKDTRIVKNIGNIHHSLPAIKLSLTKPELPKAKLREFHRPRGKFKINEKLVLAAPPVVAQPQKEESALVSQIKKSSDLNPTAGGKLILLEYTEQNPPMLSNPGMACRILHYWRPPEDDDRDPLGKKKQKKTKPKAPEMKMGQVITLGDHDESPFVGDVPSGRVVTSLNSKLFKVPIFQHKPCVPFMPSKKTRELGSSDSEMFLLCRSVSKGKKASLGDKAKSTMYVMELPDTFVAGQIEPQIEVPAPNSRSANDFIRPYMSFHILRLFKKASDGERLKIEDIARAFPNQSGTAIRKRMKEVATFERGGNDSGWWKKKSASQLTSEEEIRASIQPESVCLYESMMSGHRRLLDIGLTKLFTPSGVNIAISLLLKRLELREQALIASMIEPLGLEKREKEKQEKLLLQRDPLIRKLTKDIKVARYINEQLQLTPWNLTNNYVECHLQGKGSGMLQLGGIGDPTGRGEGFSFVRVPQSRAKKKDGEEDTAGVSAAAAVEKAVAAVTGTTADLRKLKMKEAGDVLRNLGLADADIKKLKRWDRIHMVRELSSRATAHGVAGSLSKFARGARKSLSAQQQEYRKKCDVIYERQMDVLSSNQAAFSSDEEDSDDDLDEWGKDLEADILGGDDTEKIAKRGPKNLFTKGGGGLNRSKEVLAEREDAVELRRLMEEMKEDSGSTNASSRRPDVDSSKLRTQLKASGIKEGSNPVPGGSQPAANIARGGSGFSSAIPSPTDHRSRSASPVHGPSATSSCGHVPGRKALKRVTRVIEEDGSENVKIEFIIDPKQIARYKALRQRKERQQKVEERNQFRKRKRMLAMEEDSSMLNKAKKRKQLQEELKQLQKTEEQNKGYQELLETEGEEAILNAPMTPGRSVIRCTQCGQVGHMRTNRSCPLYMADSGGKARVEDDVNSVISEVSDEPLKLKVKKSAVEEVEKITVNLSELRENVKKHHAEKKRKRILEQQAQAELYKRPYMNNVVKQSRSRMPVAHLNGNLEIVIHKLIEMPESLLFRVPVDAAAVKDYYKIIKQPMDLETMKKKIDDLEYDSMRDFIKDLELIVNNSKIYNGDASRSIITANAAKLLKKAQEELASLNTEGGLPSTPNTTSTT